MGKVSSKLTWTAQTVMGVVCVVHLVLSDLHQTLASLEQLLVFLYDESHNVSLSDDILGSDGGSPHHVPAVVQHGRPEYLGHVLYVHLVLLLHLTDPVEVVDQELHAVPVSGWQLVQNSIEDSYLVLLILYLIMSLQEVLHPLGREDTLRDLPEITLEKPGHSVNINRLDKTKDQTDTRVRSCLTFNCCFACLGQVSNICLNFLISLAAPFTR